MVTISTKQFLSKQSKHFFKWETIGKSMGKSIKIMGNYGENMGIHGKRYLVGGAINHLEKYEFVNGKDHFPYMKWKIKFMFETTNQFMLLNGI